MVTALTATSCRAIARPGAGWSEAEARTSHGPDPKGRKLDHCFLQKGIATPQLNAGGNSTVLRAPEGKVVSRVSVKAGPSCVFTPDNTTGTWTYQVNGASCFSVEGLGTPQATVRRLGNGRGCVGLSHVQFLSATPAPSGDNSGGNTGGGNTGGGSTGGDTGGVVGDPLLGSLVVCSNVTGSSASFGISISTRFQEIALFEVPANGCTSPIQVEEGWYIVSQGLPEGIAVSDISSDPSGRIVSADPLGGAATALVLTAERTTLTFTNAAQ